MSTKFSIVSVSFNNYDGLVSTWHSLKSQCHENWHWIVIDGGSIDQTINWLHKIAENKYRDKITFTSEPDNGIYDAMNKGISKASGEYIIFMNGGDCFASTDALSRVNQSINETGPDFIYCDAYEVIEGGVKKLKKARRHRWIWYGMFAHHQAMIFKMSHLGTLRYRMEYTIGGDYAFIAEYLQHASSIVKLDFPFCTFIRGGVSTIGEGIKQGYIDQQNIRKRIMKMNMPLIVSIGFVHKIMNSLRSELPYIYYFFRGMK